MKKIMLVAALLLTVVGSNARKFADPLPECPPFCGYSASVVSAAR